jgi:hypothetical protein
MSAPCDRFEREGLSRWDDGVPPDEHERSCEDCQAARAAYERLGEAFKALPELAPPAGWEDRVMARVDAAPKRRASSPARWVWALAAAIAAMAIAAIVLRSPRDERLAIHQQVIHGGSTRRADMAIVGDRLTVRASTAGARHAALRVYRGERDLVLSCPGDTRCRMGDGEIEATLSLDAKGAYRALLLAGDAPLAAPSGSLDGDARAARAGGARVELGAAVEVE